MAIKQQTEKNISCLLNIIVRRVSGRFNISQHELNDEIVRTYDDFKCSNVFRKKKCGVLLCDKHGQFEDLLSEDEHKYSRCVEPDPNSDDIIQTPTKIREEELDEFIERIMGEAKANLAEKS